MRIRQVLGGGALVAAAVLFVSGSGADSGAVQVLRAIPYASGSEASQTVKDECELHTKVPAFLDAYSDDVELVSGALESSGRVLELKIENVHAPGGGAWSGAKSMTVTGVLRESGRELGSFTAKRYSGGGMFGAYKGTCGIVGRCAKAIGKDIANWLRSPEKGSRLGDA